MALEILEYSVLVSAAPASSTSVVLLGGSRCVDGSGETSDMIAGGLKTEAWEKEGEGG